MLSTCFVVACLYFLLQSAATEVSTSSPNFSVGSTYDANSEMCCHGVSSPFSSWQLSMCCGQAVYEFSGRICCGNKVFPLEVDQICCGDRMIAPSTQICCNGASYSKSSNSVRCCKNATYDPNTELCCPYNQPSIIIKDRDSSRTNCCGNMTYNPSTEICCSTTFVDDEGQLQERRRVLKKTSPIDDQCCGNETFSYNSKICCHDQVYDESSFACCGDKGSFSRSTQLCCNDYAANEYNIFNSKALKCCGSKSYDPSNQVCCGKTVHDNPNGKKLACCMEESYDSDTNVCCLNYTHGPPTVEQPPVTPQITKKTSNSDNACCAGISYNNKTQFCCIDDNEGKQHLAQPLSQFPFQCCGDIAFGFMDNYLCCGGEDNGNATTQPRLIKLPSLFPDTYECCGDQIYKVGTSSCCGGLILKSSDRKKACCVDKVYNTDTQICCVDNTRYPPPVKVNDKILASPLSNQCCGVDLYDPRKERCCERSRYNLVNGMSCCSNGTYDPTRELCCMDNVITKQNQNHNSCCYNFS